MASVSDALDGIGLNGTFANHTTFTDIARWFAGRFCKIVSQTAGSRFKCTIGFRRDLCGRFNLLYYALIEKTIFGITQNFCRSASLFCDFAWG